MDPDFEFNADGLIKAIYEAMLAVRMDEESAASSEQHAERSMLCEIWLS